MAYNSRVISVDQLNAHAQVLRALEHIASEDFLGLKESEKQAYAAAYRAELPNLTSRVPQYPFAMSDIHLLGTYLQLFE